MFPMSHGVVSQVLAASGGGGGSAYRYYRLRVIENNGRGTVDVATMELHATVGGANIAIGGTATATSEISSSFNAAKAFDADPSTYWASESQTTWARASLSSSSATSEFSSSFNAAKAFDADPSTYWATATGVTAAALIADLGSATHVTAYRIQARSNAADGSPKDWTVEYSDDNSSWSTAHTVTGETGWSNGETRRYAFASVGSHRYWRLNITANNGRSTINVGEWILLDEDTTARMLQYDLGEGNGAAVAEYTLQAHPSVTTGAPRRWSFEGSADGASWESLDSGMDETAWSTGETRTFTV